MPDSHPPTSPPDTPANTPSDRDVPREQPFLLAIFVVILTGATLGFIGYSVPALGTAALLLFLTLTVVAFLTAFLAWRCGNTRVIPPFDHDAPPTPPPGIE